MPLESLRPIDTRQFFRPVSTSLVALLRDLTEADRERPAVTGRAELARPLFRARSVIV